MFFHMGTFFLWNCTDPVDPFDARLDIRVSTTVYNYNLSVREKLCHANAKRMVYSQMRVLAPHDDHQCHAFG